MSFRRDVCLGDSVCICGSTTAAALEGYGEATTRAVPAASCV